MGSAAYRWLRAPSQVVVMKTEIRIYLSRAELLKLVREHSEPGDAIPDTARIQGYTDGDYTDLSEYEPLAVRICYEVES